VGKRSHQIRLVLEQMVRQVFENKQSWVLLIQEEEVSETEWVAP
jgi:hypothetical protein